jgi:hypothetical protein
MMEGEAQKYLSSGGTSELRPYDDGEQYAIELHRRSFSVLWSTSIPAKDFMHQVASLVEIPGAGYASLSPSDDDEGRYAFLDAMAKIDDGSVTADFIHLDFADRAFTWQAPDLVHDQRPRSQGQIGMICKAFRAEWLDGFIRNTATPRVAADVEHILGSTERLTSDFSPAAE